MENIDQMRQRHQEEIMALQSNCKHKEISDPMPYMWAPGHFSGTVKVCRICGVIIESDEKMFKVQ